MPLINGDQYQRYNHVQTEFQNIS